MALKTRLVEVPFFEGLDTKTDEKLVLPGKLVELENGVFTKRGKVKKRNGHVPLGKDIAGGVTEIVSGDALGIFQEELLLFNKKDLFSYSSGIDSWIDKGDVVPLTISRKQVIRNESEQILADGDTVNGVTLFAWKDSSGGVRAGSFDNISGAPLLSDTLVASNGMTPRVIAAGSSIFIIYEADDSGTHKLKFRSYDPQSPLVLGTETEIAVDVHVTNSHFDVTRHGLNMIFVYNATGVGVKIGYLTSGGEIGGPLLGLPAVTFITVPALGFVPGDVNAGTDEITEVGHGFTKNMVLQFSTDTTLPAGLSAATDYFVIVVDVDTYQVSDALDGSAVDITDGGVGIHTATPQNDPANDCLAVVVEASTQHIYVSWHGVRNGVRCAVLRVDLSLLLNPTEIESAPSDTPINLTGAILSAGGEIALFYEITAANDYDHFVRKARLTNVGVLTAPTVLKRSVGLASKAFVFDGTVYVNVVHDSIFQATYFALAEDGFIAGRESSQVAGGLVASPSLPQVFSDGVGIFRWGSLLKTRLISEDNTIFFLRGVSQTTMDFANSRRYFSAVLGENLFIVGGFLSGYDGQSSVEHGFHLFPENVSLAQAATGGFMSDGTYQYSVVFEWTDNQGQIHRSAPSVATTIVVTGGGSVQKVTVTIPSLRLTAKTSPRSEVVLSVYRTINTGSVFHKVSSISSPVFNDPTVDSVDVVDTLADTDIIANQLLYTTGGILDNISPPASSLITSGKNRIVLGGLEDGNLVWISKEHIAGEGLGFSDALTKRIDSKGGEITALATMDDNVIVFKEKKIFAFAGEGPNEAGGGPGFTEAIEIQTDVGCKVHESIADTPAGLIFKSEKGFYLLTRDLQAVYIGADAEKFNPLTVTSAVLVGNSNQIRFTTVEDPTILFDYQFNQWSTFTNHIAVDAKVWLGDYVYLKPNGEVMRETAGFFKDDNISFSLKLVTAWIKVGGIQGFQRVRRGLILGEFKSDHILNIGIGFDYQEGFPENYTFDVSQIINQVGYGDSSFYGADEVYGGVVDGVYQFERHLARQKCQAIRFSINDVFAGEPGESFEISSLGLLIGVKKGAFKPRIEKRA